MRFSNLKQDKGVAGLTVFLSLIVMLFIIGLLVMIFSLMGGEMQESSTIGASESATTTDTSLTLVAEVVTLTACASANNGAITSVASVWNSSTAGTLVSAGNYTTSGCVLSLVDGTPPYNETLGNATYTYSFGGEAWEVMNDTVGGIGGATDWFDIFIVIGAMVVLILLTVIIIVAIRGSGLVSTGGGQVRGAGNVGSA